MRENPPKGQQSHYSTNYTFRRSTRQKFRNVVSFAFHFHFQSFTLSLFHFHSTFHGRFFGRSDSDTDTTCWVLSVDRLASTIGEDCCLGGELRCNGIARFPDFGLWHIGQNTSRSSIRAEACDASNRGRIDGYICFFFLFIAEDLLPCLLWPRIDRYTYYLPKGALCWVIDTEYACVGN